MIKSNETRKETGAQFSLCFEPKPLAVVKNLMKREFNKPYMYIKGKDRKEIEAQRRLPDGILIIDIHNPENNRYGCLPYTEETSLGLVSLAKDKVMEQLVAKFPQNSLQNKNYSV